MAPVKGNVKSFILVVLTLFVGTILYSQDEDYEDLLQRVDTIENPIYLPHVSVSYGVTQFLGEVRTSNGFSVLGNPTFKVNLTTYIDNRHNFAANFFYLGIPALRGDIPGERLNFESRINTIGISSRYEFGHFFPDELRIRPYVSLGIEQVSFNSKADYMINGADFPYYYWPDGTIRDRDYNSTIPGNGNIVHRDYLYETALNQDNTFGIPLEVGFSMKINRNLYLSLGTEYHYSFSDEIDDVYPGSSYGTPDKLKDSYLFTSFSLHFDLFSEPKTRTVDLLYAEIEFDPLLFEDEDGDFIIDIADRCPGTPYGVVTDTLGCPLDDDGDGVPDYLDKEPGSSDGAWVDDEGVTISEETFLMQLKRDYAMNREDLEAYLELIKKNSRVRPTVEIPDRFKPIDTDGDGYISFDELLKVIDDYFDFRIDLTVDELREVNEFFFSQ